MSIEKRKLGRTGERVTILGLGGEGILRTLDYEKEAYSLINRALDLGITYCESARAYSGSESYYGKALKERRREVFLASKSHARDRKGALLHLQATLRNMNTDHLDLWQVHDVRTDEEIGEIFGPGGAIEAFVTAQEKGMTRFIGVTGHHDPLIIQRCIGIFPFDTVLLPVNPAEPAYNSFIDTVIPLAREKEMGVIGMKVYFRGLAERLPWYSSMEPFLHFALSQAIATAVIGCDTLQQLEENVSFAHSFIHLSDKETHDLIAETAPFAQQLMYYKR
ncbi:MAG: aldo/keto reductase [Alphaproteobacteria bacterium]|uniref:Aldo/keto reductase n=1 Tax=Candidatus Nitrobium versatile TaxID=2884831 RepID=A0A953JD56_9BACT|nr:aldo/keto reductase [Candidatus Nitrobium versatile]